MKVALVHDYLKEPGGAEAVLATLKEMYPDAPVYTAYKFPDYWGRYKETMAKWNIKESFGRLMPFLPKFISYYTIISPWFFSSMDLSGYDLVIVSQTGGYFPNRVKTGPATKMLTYCHTPPRFLYGYDTATQERYKWYWKPISLLANHILLMVDYDAAQKPNVFVANSKNVANRIRKFYRRESEVVYPPIELPKMNIRTSDIKKQDYFLIVSRIVGSKNIEMAVEAADKYGFKLKIAGRPIGSSGKRVVEMIKVSSAEYLGEVSEREKVKLLTEARGFLALEKDADFGMTAVEPQAYGTAVIAYDNGGYREAVVNGKTGVLFHELSAEGLWKGICEFNKLKFDHQAIVNNAKRFSKENFVQGMKKEISKLIKVD